jgi:hypothetical protein
VLYENKFNAVVTPDGFTMKMAFNTSTAVWALITDSYTADEVILNHKQAYSYNETFRGQKSLTWNNSFMAETINNSWAYYTNPRIAEILDLDKTFIIQE